MRTLLLRAAGALLVALVTVPVLYVVVTATLHLMYR